MKMTNFSLQIFMILSLVFVGVACSKKKSKTRRTTEVSVDEPVVDTVEATKNEEPGPMIEKPSPTVVVAGTEKFNLNWKRVAAIEADLSTALSLTPETLCNELNLYSCTKEVHLAELGGHDPFESGNYSPLSNSSLTSPVSLDRIVLTACTNKVNAEISGTKTVFKFLNLAKYTGSIATADFRNQINELYHRFMLRDPSAVEISNLEQLKTNEAGSEISNIDFAVLACYVIGTNVENIFY